MFRLVSPTHVNQYTVISLQSSEPGRRWITDEVVGQALKPARILVAPFAHGERDRWGAHRDLDDAAVHPSAPFAGPQRQGDRQLLGTVGTHGGLPHAPAAASLRTPPVQLVNAVQQGDGDFGMLGEL